LGNLGVYGRVILTRGYNNNNNNNNNNNKFYLPSEGRVVGAFQHGNGCCV
jgi:hypothetical protein